MSNNRLKRRSITLIELLIALTLMIALVSSVFFAYQMTASSSRKVDQLLWPIREKLALHQRLEELFFLVCDPDEEGFTFSVTAAPYLIFSTQNGIDRDPRFCGVVMNQLYLDREGRLILATWPRPRPNQEICWRQEVLYSRVKQLWIEAMAPPLPPNSHQPVSPPEPIQTGREQITMSPGWHSLWPHAANESPALIRLTLQRDEEEETLTFCVHSQSKIPTYWHEPAHS